MRGQPSRPAAERSASVDNTLPPSEMARRVREFDWSATPIGPRENWSASLNVTAELVLASGFPMAVRWGPDLVSIYNDAYCAILADKHPNALGQPLREVWSEIYDRLGPLNHAILRGDRPASFEADRVWRVRRRGGEYEDAHFTICYSPVPDAAAPQGIGGILVSCVETTERVRTEQALRRLNDTLEAEVAQRTLERDRIWQVSEDLLGVSNFDGYFVRVNPAWTTLLGWSEHEIKTIHVNALRHPDDAAHSVAGRKRLADGVPTVRMENRFRHKDGSWRWISWTMTAEQGLIYMIGRHVTAEKEAYATLQRAQEQLAQTQKLEAIAELTGGIAHDFNNMLMIIDGNAQLLKRRLDAPADRRAIDAIETRRRPRREPDAATARLLAPTDAEPDRDRSRPTPRRGARRARQLGAQQCRTDVRSSGRHLAGRDRRRRIRTRSRQYCRQRARRDAGRWHRHDHREKPAADAVRHRRRRRRRVCRDCRLPTTAPASCRRFCPRCSSRSSPPRAGSTAPGSDCRRSTASPGNRAAR